MRKELKCYLKFLDFKNIQEKAKIESIQAECFMSLYNFSKLYAPNQLRFGRLLNFYTDLSRLITSSSFDECFWRRVAVNKTGSDELKHALSELNVSIQV